MLSNEPVDVLIFCAQFSHPLTRGVSVEAPWPCHVGNLAAVVQRTWADWFDRLKSFLLVALTWERSSFLMSWFALGIARRDPITIPSTLCFENCPARCWKVTAGQDALWSLLVLWALSGILSYKAGLIHDSLSALWWWWFEHSRQLAAHVHPCSPRMATRFIETSWLWLQVWCAVMIIDALVHSLCDLFNLPPLSVYWQNQPNITAEAFLFLLPHQHEPQWGMLDVVKNQQRS